jgi:serine/threonine-protein kinase
MLLGEPPFTGPSTQAIIARVMTEEPRSPTLQRKSIQPHVERALLKALEKLPADRFESAAQFADALSGSGAAISAAIRAVAAPVRSRVLSPVAVAGAIALVALGIGAGRLWNRPVPARGLPARVTIPIPPDHRLSATTLGSLALSADGTMLVYLAENASGSQLYLRRLDDLMPTPIPGTAGAAYPTFSPDSRSIAFFGSSGLFKTTLGGGTTVKVPAPGGMLGALWTGADEFTVTTADGALGTLKGDGTVTRIASPIAAKGEGALLPKDVLPDGTIIVIAATQSLAGPLFAVNPRTGAREVISRTLATAAHYDDGTLFWSEAQGTAGALLCAPFDAATHKLGAAITSVAPDVRVSAGGMTHVAFSRQGVLVYVPSLPSDLVMVDRSGRAQTLVGVQRRFHHPRVSPDGHRVLVDFVEQSARDVRVLDLRDQTLRRLTFETDGHDGSWLPAGDRILYASARSGTIGMLGRRADGSGSADSLLVVSGKTLTIHAVTPDGKQGIGVSSQLAGATGANNDIVVVSLEGNRKVTPLLAAPYSEGWPSLSPDGRWLAYASDESGRFEVYVRPFPGPGGQILVSKNGGSEPIWGRNGRELFFRALGGKEPMMTAATIETHPDPRVTARTELFSAADYEVATPHANYDVTADGRFIMVRQPHVNDLILVQNWKELARRQAEPAKR